MARAKKEAALTPEERLQAALVPDWEWPYKLPENWCWVRLYSLAHIISKGTTPKGGKDAYVEKGIRFLRIENINEDGSISHENIKHITEEMHTGFLRRSILCKDDILISIAGTLGKTGIVGEADLPLNTNQAISFVRLIRGNLLPQYIKMSIDNPKTQDMLISQTKVTSIPNLTLEIIGNCAIPLAPLAEQQRIVDRIESLFAKLDEAKEKAQAVVDSFETRKAAILHKAFTGELTAKWREEHGVRMESWEKKSVGELCISLKYGTAKKSDASGNVVVLRMGNLQQGEIDWSDLAYSNDPDDIERYKLFPGDVLFNRTNSAALVGKTAIYRGEYPAIYAGYLIKLDYDHDKIIGDYLNYAFVNSRVLLVYGAAGTGKTTLIDMISTMLSGRRKLFLTKTHTALQNLQRRINNPGADASFVSINSFTKRVNLPDYDVIFVDECSTIDNRVMKVFLEKMRPDTFLVLAGDTYQIESIDFGNWFTYAKDIIKTKGSNVELVSTWRTKDPGLIALWNETRNKGALITEKLVIDGPFSENIGEGVLYSEIMDEVILCLNYDGKFGLNNMNSYFQNANTETAVVWRDWKYKVGDHILFNDTDRFSLLYNNLKGRIVQIELFDSRIRFTVDVEIPLTEQDCQNDGIEFIDIIDDVTRIRFDVFDFEEEMADEDRKKAIVPFQLAYAVSIHKAQGLEYRSVKVVIPSSNAEKITHGIFYTAITRAKEKLKIYWSSETMQEVVAGFSIDTSRQKSLAIIKEKLKQDKNT